MQRTHALPIPKRRVSLKCRNKWPTSPGKYVAAIKMKEKVIELAKYYGCTAKYSGRTRTMFIHGDEANTAVGAIRALIPFVPFKVDMG